MSEKNTVTKTKVRQSVEADAINLNEDHLDDVQGGSIATVSNPWGNIPRQSFPVPGLGRTTIQLPKKIEP